MSIDDERAQSMWKVGSTTGCMAEVSDCRHRDVTHFLMTS